MKKTVYTLFPGITSKCSKLLKNKTHESEAMFTWDRSQMDPTLSWNGPSTSFPGPFPYPQAREKALGTRLFTPHRSLIKVRPHGTRVCYGSVLNRSKKSSCFYQLNMRRIHVKAFKMAPKKAKSIEEEIKPSAGRTMNYLFS